MYTAATLCQLCRFRLLAQLFMFFLPFCFILGLFSPENSCLKYSMSEKVYLTRSEKKNIRKKKKSHQIIFPQKITFLNFPVFATLEHQF